MIYKCAENAWHNLRTYGVYTTSLRASNYLGFDTIRNQLLKKWGFERCSLDTPLFFTKIRPAEVEYMFTGEYIPKEGSRAVGGRARGTWDRHRISFRDQLVFESLEQRFICGLDWEETHMLNKELMTSGQVNWLGKWEKKDNNDLKRKCEKFDEVAENIQRHGYISQADLYKLEGGKKTEYQKRLGNLLVPDELCIAIGRNGEIIRMANAKHRLAIAIVLGINDHIPAIVQLHHSQWGDESATPVEPLSNSHLLVETATDLY